MSNRFVVVDIETTGNSPKKGDKIIQFAAVVIQDGKIVDQYSSLVNPKQPIPVFIEELTGLNDKMVEKAPLFSQIAPKIHTLLEEAYFVAHNVFFDLTFLQEELILAGYEGFFGPIIDTVELARIFFPTADSFKLNDLAAKQGIEHERPHQADSDAEVTAKLLVEMLNKLEKLPNCTIKQLSKLSAGLKSDLHLLLEDRIVENNRTIEILPEDLEIHRGIALKRIVSAENKSRGLPSLPYPKTDEEKEQLIRQAFTSFEKRQGQFKMMDLINQSFTNNRHCLIEAGTGVGKSLGYLIPALFFAVNTKNKVVVSTFTTQLQDQLLYNDIPLLQKMVTFPIKTSILKGRAHYISLEKFEQTLKENEENYDTALTKMQILIWLLETNTGDVDELNLSSGGMLFWNRIKNEQTHFVQKKHWLEWDFYSRARKAAQDGDIIITNHSLLLVHLQSEQSILPKFDYLIIDEGHHFEKAAAKHFGISIDYLKVRLLLGKLGQYEQGQLTYKLERLMETQKITDESQLMINQMLQELAYEADQLFKTINNYAFQKVSQKGGKQNRVQIRLDDRTEDKGFKAISLSAERFSFLLKDVLIEFNKKLSLLEKKDEILTSQQKIILDEFTAVLKELEIVRTAVKDLFNNRLQENIKWIEVDLRAAHNITTVFQQPLSVAHLLTEQLFSKKKSIIITSATLTVNNSFHYIERELGINSCSIEKVQIPSPFRYQERVKLLIAEDLPEVNSVPLEDYVSAISEHIISIAEATKGRMLILFTANDMLKRTYELIKESGFLEDFVIIAQGITGGSRARLTRNFQRFDKAILMGTNSFWEGIDIPGEDLSCLVIVRLPFSPPDEPMNEAKCEKVKESGGNPFYDHSLPEAILRFKQGFGRLVRTSVDKGVCVVFDKRIITTQYGRSFLKSIPPVPTTKCNIHDIVKIIHSWI